MFVTLEGIEGSGKTTQIKHIVDFLQTKGHDCIVTREPGGTEIGEKIRAILLDPGNKNLDPKAELFLYAADRAQHISHIIKPGLEKGKIVISDRYIDSTTVYQGYARGIAIGLVEKINTMVIETLKPDITFLLDLPPKIGLARTQKQLKGGERTDAESRFEQEHLAFHEQVRAGFLDLAQKNRERFYVIDAARTEMEVTNNLVSIIGEKINSSL